MATEDERAPGVEIRVHGIGDHATFSALGKPIYKESNDSRVWVGEVPSLPRHKLRLINWSRANRKLTRNFSWYVAFPFTLLNVAGYMEPTNTWSRRFMRSCVALASLCLTVAMAAWLSVTLETVWHGVSQSDDRLTAIVLQALAPALLICIVIYRMIKGRALVDKGGTAISVATIIVLLAGIVFLHSKPASRTDGLLHNSFLPDGTSLNAIDPMTTIVVYTTGIVWVLALLLVTVGLFRRNANAASFAGAAALLVVSISLLHASGSIVRLFVANIVQFLPRSNGDFTAPGSEIEYVLLPAPDDLLSRQEDFYLPPLRIDLIPAFFIVMVAIFAAIALFYGRKIKEKPSEKAVPPGEVARGSSPTGMGKSESAADARNRKQPRSRASFLITHLSMFLAKAVALGIILTASAWILLFCALVLFTRNSPAVVEYTLLALRVLGALTVVLILFRKPEKVAEQLRRTFGSIADIAGFWAPDLSPLAGASYRRAILAGLRDAINDCQNQYKDEPIALVGHSQGSVVCAWFVRGGHWSERRSEGRSDRRAIRDGLHNIDRSAERRAIALFTCGSPLASLYQTFFPRYFDRNFFETTLCMSAGGRSWHNYWRATDPIGTKVDLATNHDVTETVGQDTNGHGEYWKEAILRTEITASFDSPEQTLISNLDAASIPGRIDTSHDAPSRNDSRPPEVAQRRSTQVVIYTTTDFV